MPDYSWTCLNCKIENPAYTEVCRECSFPFQNSDGEPDITKNAESKPKPQNSAPKPTPALSGETGQIRKSPVMRAFVIAVSICIFQILAIIAGFLFENAYLLLIVYFYTAFPSNLLAWSGIPLTDSFMHWPTGLGIGIGLVIWGIVYFLVALRFIK